MIMQNTKIKYIEWNKWQKKTFHWLLFTFLIPAYYSFGTHTKLINLRLQSHQKYLTAANVDHPIARDENMIPKRPFIFTKMDKPARPMTGSKQYPTKKSSI